MSSFPIDAGFLAEICAEAVSWRHYLHQHPELAHKEWQTSDFVAAQLQSFGLKIHRGLAETGVVGTLSCGAGGATIGIRADMDALPITEKSGVPYASHHPGLMHACGHDGHVAIALAAARICTRFPDLNGTVHFIFQPAEENEGGGRRMVEEGLFELFPCDSIYALHNWPALPLGTCVARDGPMMAAFGTFEIAVLGRGCHGAMPHQGSDAILAGSQLVSALQSIVSRNVDPTHSAVVSVTQIHAGDTWNVIPDRCILRGTTRWFDEKVGLSIENRIRELAVAVAGGFSCEATLEYKRRMPATINTNVMAQEIRALVGRDLPELQVAEAAPSMGSDDFAFMLNTVPGCYIWLGAGTTEHSHGLHSPQYDFNDDALPHGVALWLALVRHALASSSGRTV